MVDWNTMNDEPTTRGRKDTTRTRAIMEGTFTRPDKSAKAIAAHLRNNGVDVTDTYTQTTINFARATLDYLLTGNEVHHNGATYQLVKVPPAQPNAHSLTRKVDKLDGEARKSA